MYTYLFQDRVVVPQPKDAKIEIPNNVTINVVMEPLIAFGVSKGPGRLFLRDKDNMFIFDANTGRIQVDHKKPLSPVEAILVADNIKFELQGNKLEISLHCEDYEKFYSILRTYLHLFPTLLNLALAEPPIVKEITGKVGNTRFRWEYVEATAFFPELSQEDIESELMQSYQRIGSLTPQIAASLHYFYMASRLIVSGNSPWEFMAESILNFCKALQILFGEKLDDVRSGLKSLDLGYTQDEIEGDFIPIMVPRNYFDVGHSQVATPDMEQCKILYAYLSETEANFRDFFRRLLEDRRNKVTDQPIKLTQTYDKEKQKIFDRLISTIEKRLIEHRYEERATNSVPIQKDKSNCIAVHARRN